MKNKITYFTYIRTTLMLLVFSVLCFTGFGQNNAAQPQPVKKANTVPANTNNNNAKPWEKQPMQPAKNKSAGTMQSTNAKPAQAQPIQHK
jgi:hypothetical protein